MIFKRKTKKATIKTHLQLDGLEQFILNALKQEVQIKKMLIDLIKEEIKVKYCDLTPTQKKEIEMLNQIRKAKIEKYKVVEKDECEHVWDPVYGQDQETVGWFCETCGIYKHNICKHEYNPIVDTSKEFDQEYRGDKCIHCGKIINKKNG